MSAALALVAARADDDSPVATWADDDGAPLAYLTRARVDALVAETRGLIEHAGANLIELRRGNAHLVAGYATWHEAVEAWFGDLTIYRLVKDRQQRVAERQALVASMTLAGHTVREQHDKLGASVGIVYKDQRSLGLVPDKRHPIIDAEPVEPLNPFRGLTRTQEALARVAAQDGKGLTSTELDLETGWPMGTATGLLSRLERGRGGRGGGLLAFGEGLRERRMPYVVTDAGRARLAVILAARDDAERQVP